MLAFERNREIFLREILSREIFFREIFPPYGIYQLWVCLNVCTCTYECISMQSGTWLKSLSSFRPTNDTSHLS